MRELAVDVCVVGGGPAGMAAALEARRGGATVTLMERDWRLGGILGQCVHDGFGLMRFGESLTGPAYAQRFSDEVAAAGIEVLLDTMVLEVTPSREVWAVNEGGVVHARCGTVVLAMGCRERTAAQAGLHGYRPQGVITAGACQRYINVDGYLPGTRAVVVGSGDVGLIMARRMTLEGIEVEGVYEIAPHPGGLARNVVQCLDDYGIPLHLSHMVTCVHGKDRLEGVTVARIDAAREPVPGTERRIDCDLLVLAAGLIPENELTRAAGAAMDPRTRGPVLDQDLMTSVPGFFSAGNVSVVFDLVDYVSLSGERAARGALAFLRGKRDGGDAAAGAGAETGAGHDGADEGDGSSGPVEVRRRGNVSLCVPQRVRTDAGTVDARFFLRVREPQERVAVTCVDAVTGVEYARQRLVAVAPATMVDLEARLPRGARPVIDVSEVG